MRVTKRLSMMLFLVAAFTSTSRYTDAWGYCEQVMFGCPVFGEEFECFASIDCDKVRDCLREYCTGGFDYTCGFPAPPYGGASGTVDVCIY